MELASREPGTGLPCHWPTSQLAWEGSRSAHFTRPPSRPKHRPCPTPTLHPGTVPLDNPTLHHSAIQVMSTGQARRLSSLGPGPGARISLHWSTHRLPNTSGALCQPHAVTVLYNPGRGGVWSGTTRRERGQAPGASSTSNPAPWSSPALDFGMPAPRVTTLDDASSHGTGPPLHHTTLGIPNSVARVLTFANQ